MRVDALSTAFSDNSPHLRADGLEAFVATVESATVTAQRLFHTRRATTTAPWDPLERLTVTGVPATSVDDLMMALGLDHRRAGRARIDPRPLPRGVAHDVVEHCRTQARTIEQLSLVAGLELGDAAMHLARLEHQGWVRETGGWFETVDAWGDLA
jgi:predicted Rossmann fold nucleotide-binding protein DprA/Smf involved in DNA uptake